METVKLFDSELKIMEIVWEHEPVSAKDVSVIAFNNIGWNKNTTYTIIKKLIKKDAIKRSEPNFICTSLIKKGEVQESETNSLIDKLYGGSKKAFFAAFMDDNSLTDDEVAELKAMIEKW